ncbi:MAG: rod shape-determining protein MreC [Minisyncoccota bacterium]
MIFIRFAIIIVLFVALFNNNLIFVKDHFLSSLSTKNEIEDLELQNDSLKTQLYISENLSGKEIKDNKWDYFYAKVFSSYPFNDQNLIAVNSGEMSGVNIGQSVAVAPGILLGQVIKIGKNISLIRTIFDKDFIASVKIGENKVSALLKGGTPPTLEMIEKNKDIKNGEIVYSVDQNYPYGFKLGEVKMIEGKNTDTAGVFKNAFLKTTYSVASLEDVLIIKNFETLKK